MNRNLILPVSLLFTSVAAFSQIGKRFPAERKVLKDPATGTMLTFLTSTPNGDTKIYQTHNQWTSDQQWLIFRSNRVRGEAMAVNEKTGDIVQVTEGGFAGMLNIARKSMKLYFMRYPNRDTAQRRDGDTSRRQFANAPMQIIEVDLAKLFADSKAGTLKPANVYQRVCGTTPAALGAGGDMALDGAEDWAYFRVGREEAAKHLPADAKLEKSFGPRNMGAGPSGIAAMNITTGEIKYVVSVPFQVGHIQTNPWVAGEIVFCWETGGKSPQRTWTVMADGSGLRPLYPESEYEWVTHETVISKDEVAIAIMGHRKIPGTNKPVAAGTPVSGINPGQEAAWGPSGTREKPTGLGIVNLRTREMVIVGQTPEGSGLWHVNGSSDGRWAVGDDFARNIYLIDRHTKEMILLSAGHKATAADHPHPTFSPDGTRIQIQSAMLSADNRSMNICIIPVPEEWLKRTYNDASLKITLPENGKLVNDKSPGKGWINLVASLDDWTLEKPNWKLENGILHGDYNGGKLHSYGYTKTKYTNFELNAVVRMTGKEANSGVCIRINPTDFDNAPGYQVDMGPGYWGSLWEERRESMVQKYPTELADKLVKADDWNHYYIIANGHHIQAWLNGVKTIDTVHVNGFNEGSIGLQLCHGDKHTVVDVKTLELRVVK